MWRPNQNHRLENMTFFVRNGADGAELLKITLGTERVESGSEEGSMRYPGPLDAGLSLSVSYPLGSGPPCSMTVESFR